MMNFYQLNISAQTQYLSDQSDPEEGLFFFSYTIAITNTGSVAAQLISRHWLIQQDNSSEIREVNGLGVVGQQPLIQPGETFEYTSNCQLSFSSGSMHGEFFFVAIDRHRFEVAIPTFVLVAQPPQIGRAHV